MAWNHQQEKRIFVVSGEQHTAAPLLILWHHQTWQLKIVGKCGFHVKILYTWWILQLAMFDYQWVYISLLRCSTSSAIITNPHRSQPVQRRWPTLPCIPGGSTSKSWRKMRSSHPQHWESKLKLAELEPQMTYWKFQTAIPQVGSGRIKVLPIGHWSRKPGSPSVRMVLWDTSNNVRSISLWCFSPAQNKPNIVFLLVMGMSQISAFSGFPRSLPPEKLVGLEADPKSAQSYP